MNWWRAVTFHWHSWTHRPSEVLQASQVLWNISSRVNGAKLLTFPAVSKHGVVLLFHFPFCQEFFILMKFKTVQSAELCTCNVGLKMLYWLKLHYTEISRSRLLCLLSALFFTKFCVVIHWCRKVVSAHTWRAGKRCFVIHNLVHDISSWSICTNWCTTFQDRQSFVSHFNRNKRSDLKESGHNLFVNCGALHSGVSTQVWCWDGLVLCFIGRSTLLLV